MSDEYGEQNTIVSKEEYLAAKERLQARFNTQGKSRKMTKFFQIAVWVIVVSGIVFWWRHTENNKSKAKVTEQAQKETIHKAVIELANKHNAVVDWKKPISKKSFMSPIFTMEIENVLLSKDNRPVLFLAKPKDIERKENAYVVRFTMVRFTNDFGRSPQIEFALDCSDEQAKKILQQRTEFKDRYAIIAVINKVKKMAFEVVPVIEGSGEDAHSTIEIDTPDTFVAIGCCIDLLFVEDYDVYDLSEDKGK